jgi:hypothetical protein
MKASSIKTTPHNLAAIISKIKSNNETSGSTVSAGAMGALNSSIN